MSDEIEDDVQEVEESASVEDVSVPDEPVDASPYDSFRQLPQFEGHDDESIAKSLYQTMQSEQAARNQLKQYQGAIPLVQQYLTDRKEYEEWKNSRNQPDKNPVAPQTSQKNEEGWKWDAPELKESYKRYLVKDENGRDAIHPDAPLDARSAITEWMDFRADFAQKLLNNPEDALGPMVQGLAQKQAQEMIQETLTKRDNESFVEKIEAENRDWLFDPQTGSVTPAGLLMNKHIVEAKGHGIGTPKARWEYALAMTERDLLAQRFDSEAASQGQRVPRQAPPPQQEEAPVQQPADSAQENMEYLRKEASRNVSRSGGASNKDPRQPRPKQSFEDMLLSEAQTKGFA